MSTRARRNDPPQSVEDTLLVLRNYFRELQSAQCDFEILWFATGRGERLPDERELKTLLRRIAGRAELMELAFVSLRMLHGHSQLTKSRPQR